MNDKNRQNKTAGKGARSAKECAYLAVFVALVVAVQFVLSWVPGAELVTVLFVSYAFAMGAKRGMLAATAFSLLRQLVFGFFPTVLILYFLYFNSLAFLFGTLGGTEEKKGIWKILLIACFCTVCFTLFDNLLNVVWYGYAGRVAKAYMLAALPFMIPQVVCTAVSVGLLFVPLTRLFFHLKKGL